MLLTILTAALGLATFVAGQIVVKLFELAIGDVSDDSKLPRWRADQPNIDPLDILRGLTLAFVNSRP
jgi:hypothetical protein